MSRSEVATVLVFIILILLAVSTFAAGFWSPEAEYYRAINVEREGNEARRDSIKAQAAYVDSAAKAIGILWDFEGEFETKNGRRPTSKEDFLTLDHDSTMWHWKNALVFSYRTGVRTPEASRRSLPDSIVVNMNMTGGIKYRMYAVSWSFGRKVHLCSSSSPVEMRCNLADASERLAYFSAASRCERELSLSQAKLDSVDRYAIYLCPSYSAAWAARIRTRQGGTNQPRQDGARP